MKCSCSVYANEPNRKCLIHGTPGFLVNGLFFQTIGVDLFATMTLLPDD